MLTLGDILDDLNAEEEQQSQHDQIGSLDSLSYSPVESFVAPIGTDSVGLESSTSLHGLFDRSFNQLNIALTKDGHAWTSCTEQLCAALGSADSLVAEARTSLHTLSSQILKLSSMVERGLANSQLLLGSTSTPQSLESQSNVQL